MKLRTARVSGGSRPWAVIDSDRPFGDQILASDLSEPDAATCLTALFMARRSRQVEGRHL